jgi:predicted MFS family arabinose efflux permease
VLASAWGFACGMAYSSFFMQLARLGESDPSGISSVKVVALKAVMMAAAVAALVVTLRRDTSR